VAGGHHVGAGEAEEVVVALEVLPVVAQAVAAVVGLGEAVALQEGPQGAVQDEDALVEQAAQRGGYGIVRETVESGRGRERVVRADPGRPVAG
jgi:hypothetical protein